MTIYHPGLRVVRKVYGGHRKTNEITSALSVDNLSLCSFFFVFLAIQLIGSNFKVLQHYQGLTMAYLGQQLKRLIPVGLQLDPKKQALVTNGRPGHLQFYSLQKDKQLFNVGLIVFMSLISYTASLGILSLFWELEHSKLNSSRYIVVIFGTQ